MDAIVDPAPLKEIQKFLWSQGDFDGLARQSLPAADRELIAETVKSTLDAQIDELAAGEPALIENFKGTSVPVRQVAVKDTEAVIAEFDKIWLPKAPVLAELRKVGATI